MLSLLKIGANGRPSWESCSVYATRSSAVESVFSSPGRTVETAEIGVQTEDGATSVAHVLVQAGEGRLLSEEELRDEATQEELRVSDRVNILLFFYLKFD